MLLTEVEFIISLSSLSSMTSGVVTVVVSTLIESESEPEGAEESEASDEEPSRLDPKPKFKIRLESEFELEADIELVSRIIFDLSEPTVLKVLCPPIVSEKIGDAADPAGEGGGVGVGVVGSGGGGGGGGGGGDDACFVGEVEDSVLDIVTALRLNEPLFWVARDLSLFAFERVKSPKTYVRSMSDVSVMRVFFPLKNCLNIFKTL